MKYGHLENCKLYGIVGMHSAVGFGLPQEELENGKGVEEGEWERMEYRFSFYICRLWGGAFRVHGCMHTQRVIKTRHSNFQGNWLNIVKIICHSFLKY